MCYLCNTDLKANHNKDFFRCENIQGGARKSTRPFFMMSAGLLVDYCGWWHWSKFSDFLERSQAIASLPVTSLRHRCPRLVEQIATNPRNFITFV